MRAITRKMPSHSRILQESNFFLHKKHVEKLFKFFFVSDNEEDDDSVKLKCIFFYFY